MAEHIEVDYKARCVHLEMLAEHIIQDALKQKTIDAEWLLTRMDRFRPYQAWLPCHANK